MRNDRFKLATEFAHDGNIEGWSKGGGVPSILWRSHVTMWAASNGLRLEGDFVECGVHTGILSMAICHYLDFNKINKKFYLFDTFQGIPMERLDETDRLQAERINSLIYFDVYEIAKRNFSTFKNVQLIKGNLPDTLDIPDLQKISYLSIDLNNARYEKETIEALWEKLVDGAMVVIDDYAFTGHEAQYQMWNDFASRNNRIILTVPTGQGLLVK